MNKLAAILFLLFPLTSLAQFVVSGKVVNSVDKTPVANASIFLSNTIVGTKTAENGTFTLNSVRPGQYDLVVSIIGFETFHKAIMVSADANLPALEISPKTILLKEVRIGPNRDWDNDYFRFKRLFLGTSENAVDCKILNPKVLDFDYDPSTHVFTATSSDFIEVVNKALGYKIRYLLTNFSNDSNTGVFYCEGSTSFEELTGSASQQRRWQKNRLNAYLGSSMHFLRSAVTNTFEKEGFRVLRLIRKLNPDYKKGLNGKYTETLVTTPLAVNDFLKLTDIKGQFALGFDDCLYVLYDRKKATEAVKGGDSKTKEHPEYLNDPLTTTIIFDAPYAFFDLNGIIINPQSVLFDGNWGFSRVADLLPVDYVP